MIYVITFPLQAFLAQIAQTEVGAATLLEGGVIPRLCELTILHQLPVSSELYKQHLLIQPVFTLLTSLLTSLGNKHVQANRQVSFSNMLLGNKHVLANIQVSFSSVLLGNKHVQANRQVSFSSVLTVARQQTCPG